MNVVGSGHVSQRLAIGEASGEPLGSATQAVARDAAPLAQRVALAEADVRDLDGRIAQLDAMVKAAIGHGWTKTAMALIGRQTASRATLVAERRRSVG